MVENLGKLLSNVLEIYDSMKFNILILYEKVLKDFRKTVHCALGLRCPDRQRRNWMVLPMQHLQRHQGPDPEAASPHLLLCTPSRLTGSAAS